jgi:cytochrome c peroxidase
LPSVDAVGSAFTINGTNFEASTSSDRAWINLSRVAVNSSTTTSIAAAVTGGATSGRVAVYGYKRLSAGGTHSCATCHDPARAFAD